MQPYFFPYIGYFQLIHAVDVFVIYNDVNYINRGWINRNNILINNVPHYITLQLEKASQNKLIYEINIVSDPKNREGLFKKICTSYAKAPYYSEVIPIIDKIVFNKEAKLDKYLEFSIRELSAYVDIDTTFVKSSEIDKNNALRGQEKILEIARKLKADHYINPIGGVELYEKGAIERYGISLNFIKTDTISYAQFSENFVPNLSIIDVMMFNSKRSLKELLAKYTLV